MHVRTDYTPKYTYIFTFIELLTYIGTYNIYFCISCKIVNRDYYFSFFYLQKQYFLCIHLILFYLVCM